MIDRVNSSVMDVALCTQKSLYRNIFVHCYCFKMIQGVNMMS